ncbi:MAG: excinuclease ABC subunit UvrC [Thermodesulfobacteriota bacterium]
MHYLTDKLKSLPDAPGVYMMRNVSGQVIYVGKARSLRNRVRSYFQRGIDANPKTKAMLARLSDLDYIITSSEVEALILENNLIKEHRPRYNVILKDDKNYPCLKLTMGERFPRLYIVRQIKKDDSVYFGPFTSAQALRETLRLVYRLFGLRRCPEYMLKQGRPCIYCQMNQCLAPCTENVDEEKYRRVVEQIKEFFQGKGYNVVTSLRQEMEREAENLNFERAAKLRDQIRSLKKVLTKQRMVSSRFLDQDYLGITFADGFAQVELLFVRAGKLIGNQSFSLPNRRGLPASELVSAFLKQFYSRGKFIPQEIIIPVPVEDAEVIASWLSEKKSSSVSILVPQRGDRAKVLKMASANAANNARGRMETERSELALLEELKARLRLKNFPQRIEAYDISNIQGANAVGSLVVFQAGRPLKSDYRHYKIKTLESPNDYLMMHEVLSRRFSRAIKENSEMADLVIVDGGKGQLAVALQVFDELCIAGVDVIGLAKPTEDEGLPTGKGEEKIYMPHVKDAVKLSPRSPLLHLLQRIRDESHRFAVSYHRKLRKRGALRSSLEDIPGIGPAKRRALLQHFDSLKQVINASLEELRAAPKLTRADAGAVFSYFQQRGESSAVLPPGRS